MGKNRAKYLFVFLLAAVIGYLLVERTVLHNGSEGGAETNYLSLFGEVSALIRSHYVENVNPADKFPNAFNTMLGVLDEYSAYLDVDRSRNYLAFCRGEAYGLGILGRKEQNYFTVTHVIPGSPAHAAGIESGDSIRSLNGRSVYGLSYWSTYLGMLSSEIRSLEVGIKQEGEESLHTHSLEAAKITPPRLYGQAKPGVQYFPLMTMTAETVARLRELTQTSADTAWIIDLRYYSGGDFESFKACASLFLPPQTLLIKKRGEIETVHIGSGNPPSPRAVFVVDDSTMLFSELFAHVLKTNGYKVIGQNSGGFAPWFQQFFLEDGSSVLLKVGRFASSTGDSLPAFVKPDVICDTADSAGLLEICLNTLEAE